MKELKREIEAYALQNAIEFGKADASRVLPKLFQHGLQKEEIKLVMPVILEIVKKVNSLNDKDKEKLFSEFKDAVKVHEEKERELPELQNANKKMVFRVAPFPSGALHLGNAKTALLNALYAEKYNAKLLLVLDDTIGSEEKQPIKEAYKLIEDGFKLLGVKYHKPIIYKSDRLRTYYKYAEQLIAKNRAYVCHCSSELLRENRANGIECGCRQLPVAIQKKRWKEMFNAEEGDAILRFKTSMQHPNPAFRDRVLFKIVDRKHPRVGNKYRVWPSLEMTWAIDDHLLGVTHIIRGNDLMIETDMEKEIWDIFKWKHPVTIHSGLIKVEGMGAKISKSKAQKEVNEGTFMGWDDPRTWSIQSLIRRGIKKEAIREFVKDIGLNKQDIVVPIDTLYSHNRKLIDPVTSRYYFVENPVSITLEGLPSSLKIVEVPIHPDKPEKRKINLINTIQIAKKDFDMYKGQEVRLLHLCNIKLGEKSKVTGLENKNIPRIQWVAKPIRTKALMIDGTSVEGLAEEAISKIKIGEVIQFERFGFVRFDGKEKGIHSFWFAHN